MLPPLPPGAMQPGPPPAPMPMGAMPMMPPPPVPAALAGQAAAALVPQQEAEQAAQLNAQRQQTLANLLGALQSAPNPAAEAAGGMPAPMVTPDNNGGAMAVDPSDPNAMGA